MLRYCASALVLLAVLVFPGGPVSSADEKPAALANLSPTEVEKLGSQKLLITPITYRQIFEPYLKSDLPVFITTDSLLNAFHVLFDDATFRFEQINAGRLPEIVRLLWQSISPRKASPVKPVTSDGNTPGAKQDSEDEYRQLETAARHKAQFAVGVGLKLLGDTETQMPDEIQLLIDEEVRNIVRASGQPTPAWPEYDDGYDTPVDYSVFRPIGFYSRSESLQRYFRTMRWFQTYPFMIDRDKDLLAIMMLGKSLSTAFPDDRAKRLKIEKFFKCYNELMRAGRDLDILLAAQIRRDRPTDLEAVRRYIADKAAAKDTGHGRAVPSSGVFHIVAPVESSDTRLFQQTTALQDFDRRRPSGLEVCAAIGSSYAGDQLAASLPSPYGQLLIQAIDESRDYLNDPGLFNSYLNCLAALVDPAEPDAPAFMSGGAWQAKGCNTVLSGWVQFRHRLRRDAYATVYAVGEALEGLPPGFVEPDPEFYGRIGDLVDRLTGSLERCGVFAPARYRIAADLRHYAKIVEEKKYHPVEDKFTDLNQAEIAVVARSSMILSVVGSLQFEPEIYKKERQKVIEQILDFARRLEMGEYDDDPTYQALIIESGLDTKLHWQSLQHMCRWLENLAHKQLRGVAFNERENYFLTEFGERLASVMLYGGYSYLHPLDNTPSVVQIFKDPEKGGYLYAGIGRPREILVLYPFQNKEILCRGAILPYYEFVGISSYSDVEWKKRLDSDERPASPKWMKPIVAPGAPQLSTD